MKLSIENFKAIKTLHELEISKLNLLAGVNSAGKSTVSQLLILLKQSLRGDYAAGALSKGDILRVDAWRDLIHDKNNGKFGFTLQLNRHEVDNATAYDNDNNMMTGVKVRIVYEPEKEFLTVHTFDLAIMGEQYERTFKCIKMVKDRDRYKLSSNIPSLKFKANNGGYFVTFSSMFPLFYELQTEDLADSQTVPITVVKYVKDTLQSYFKKVFYVGPRRGSGPDCYQSFVSTNLEDVGKDGAYTRFILYQERYKEVSGNEKLLEAVSRYMCDEWKLAQKIEATKGPQNVYDVKLIDNRGVSVNLWQTGFGISQVLPIVVQGLLCPKGGTLIVDSPEIHMHPSVQAGLVDFFIEMALAGKNVIIETHSDHVITRLRRRIAEKTIGTEDVNIYFVTQKPEGSEYESVSLNDKGAITSQMPPGFLDTIDEDFRAILKARAQS